MDTSADRFWQSATPRDLDDALSNGLKVLTPDLDGRTPLHYVARWSIPPMVDKVLDAGANIAHHDWYGKIPYDYALDNPHIMPTDYCIYRLSESLYLLLGGHKG